MVLRLELYNRHAGYMKTCMLMSSKGRFIFRKDIGEDFPSLIKLCDTLTAKSQDSCGKGSITKLTMSVEPPNPELSSLSSLPAKMKKGHRLFFTCGQNKK